MICDLAEVYRIYDYKGVPGRLLGTLVAGLGVDSRVYQKLSGQKVPTSTLMQALIVDELRRIIYVINADKNAEQPDPMAPKLLEETEPKRETQVFSTPEAFLKARADLIGANNGRN